MENEDKRVLQEIEMKSKFFFKSNLTSSEKKRIRKIWENSFDKNNEDMELLDTTIVATVLDKKKIVAISFLLCPTKELLKSAEIKSYSNIKEQGVTENDGYLYNFCVSKRKRKNGYGKFLLQECHEYLKRMKKQKLLLFVEHENIPAICLYNKFGYKVHRATPGGFVMKKNLQ